MPPGRYAKRTPEEQAEIDAHRRVLPVKLNNGLTCHQVFLLLEDLLRYQRKEMTHVGYYLIWQKFLNLADEPSSRLLGAKMAQGYVGPLLTNDVPEEAELLPQGITPLELGRRSHSIRLAYIHTYLKNLTHRLPWERMSDEYRVAEAFAAQVIFDLGYAMGQAGMMSAEPNIDHIMGNRNCTCVRCLNVAKRDPGIQRVLGFVGKELK